MSSKSVLVSLNEIGYLLESKKYLFKGISLSVKAKTKIGLIGRNGAGKTTLLKIISENLVQTEGNIRRMGSVYCCFSIDQIDQKEKVDKLYEYINSRHEEWWEVVGFLKRKFKLNLDENLFIKDLSKGELTKINLAIGFIKDPEVLILDEPTNHLDIKGLIQLDRLLSNFKNSYIIVSHNVFFLSKSVNRIWELEKGAINEYGYGYQDYIKQKRNEIDAQKRKYLAEIKRLEKLRKSRGREECRVARSFKVGYNLKHHGKGKKADRSTDRLAMGFFKDKSQRRATQNKEMFEKRERKILKDIDRLKIEKIPTGKLRLISSEEKLGKLLLSLEKARLKIRQKNQVLVKDFNLNLRFGEKIAINGVNGSGKTSLINSFFQKNSKAISLTFKKYYLFQNLEYAYIDQSYSIVNKNLTLVKNILINNSKIGEKEAKQVLSDMLLCKANDFTKKAIVLSGGETARLAFAIEILKNLDLIILDEPTNNLDIESTKVIIEALSCFKGAILVISHNVDFLNQIGIDKAYLIKDKRLQLMKNSPLEKEKYYRELIENLD